MRGRLLSLLALTSSLGGTQILWAADMPLKAPVVAPPSAEYNWAGWYAGGNIGYGWGSSSDPGISIFDPINPGTGFPYIGFASYFASGGNVIADLKPTGMIGGGEIGFNWTLAPAWVAGLVTDFQGSGMKNGVTNTVTPPVLGAITTNQSNSEQIDWFGTFRAKVGYAQNNWLLYGTGGLAYGHVATSGSFVSVGILDFTGSNSTTRVGWAAGAGLDYGLTSNWVVGVEYLYVDLGDVSYTETQPAVAPSTLTISNHATAQIARASLDYKF